MIVKPQIGIRDVAFSPEGKLLLFTHEKILGLWTAERSSVWKAEGEGFYSFRAHFSPDGRLATWGSSGSGIQVLDVATGRPMRTFFNENGASSTTSTSCPAPAGSSPWRFSSLAGPTGIEPATLGSTISHRPLRKSPQPQIPQ